MVKWLNSNNLTLNEDKCEYMIFRRRRKKFATCNRKLYLNGKELRRVTSAKFLGVYLDEFLDWRIHVSNLTVKISKFVPILYRVRDQLTSNSLKIVYNALISPNFYYCCSVWGSCNQSVRNSLNVLQRKLIRIICFEDRCSHALPLFIKEHRL